MEEVARGPSIGHRIRSIRKERGIKSTADLAALIPGGSMSGAVLRNIEAGVKTDLSVSQLLNIARALGVSPIFLLASIRDPDSRLDLPNLSDDLREMSAFEFDEWLSGGSDWIHDWTSVQDQSERNQLRAMRELERQAKERDRLALVIEQAPKFDEFDEETDDLNQLDALATRKAEAVRQVKRLSNYLRSAGWDVQRWR